MRASVPALLEYVPIYTYQQRVPDLAPGSACAGSAYAPEDMGYAPPGYSYAGYAGYGEMRPYIKYGKAPMPSQHCCREHSVQQQHTHFV